MHLPWQHIRFLSCSKVALITMTTPSNTLWQGVFYVNKPNSIHECWRDRNALSLLFHSNDLTFTMQFCLSGMKSAGKIKTQSTVSALMSPLWTTWMNIHFFSECFLLLRPSPWHQPLLFLVCAKQYSNCYYSIGICYNLTLPLQWTCLFLISWVLSTADFMYKLIDGFMNSCCNPVQSYSNTVHYIYILFLLALCA